MQYASDTIAPLGLQAATFLDESWAVIRTCEQHRALLHWKPMKGNFRDLVVDPDPRLEFLSKKAPNFLVLHVLPVGCSEMRCVLVRVAWMGNGMWSMQLQDISMYLKLTHAQQRQQCTILSCVDDPVMMIDENLQVSYANAAMTDMLGYHDESFIGIPLSHVAQDIQLPDDTSPPEWVATKFHSNHGTFINTMTATTKIQTGQDALYAVVARRANHSPSQRLIGQLNEKIGGTLEGVDVLLRDSLEGLEAHISPKPRRSPARIDDGEAVKQLRAGAEARDCDNDCDRRVLERRIAFVHQSLEMISAAKDSLKSIVNPAKRDRPGLNRKGSHIPSVSWRTISSHAEDFRRDSADTLSLNWDGRRGPLTEGYRSPEDPTRSSADRTRSSGDCTWTPGDCTRSSADRTRTSGDHGPPAIPAAARLPFRLGSGHDCLPPQTEELWRGGRPCGTNSTLLDSNSEKESKFPNHPLPLPDLNATPPSVSNPLVAPGGLCGKPAAQETGPIVKRVTILSVRLRPLERLVDVPDVGAHAKQYLETVSKVKQVVQKHHGSLHNAAAGRFLISFNVLTPCTTQVQRAYRTAQALHDLQLGSLTCGIACGPTLVGAAHGEMQEGAIFSGDVVNQAWGLERLCVLHGMWCLVSASDAVNLHTVVLQWVDVVRLASGQVSGVVAVMGMNEQSQAAEWMYELQAMDKANPYAPLQQAFRHLLAQSEGRTLSAMLLLMPEGLHQSAGYLRLKMIAEQSQGDLEEYLTGQVQLHCLLW